MKGDQLLDWEAICDGCGKCCEIGRTGVACPQLDTSTNRCTDYANRLEVEPCCRPVRPDNVLTLHGLGILPDSCAYVRYMTGQGPLENPPRATLIPFALAGQEGREAYARARAAADAKKA